LPEEEEQCLQDRARSVFDKAATKVVRDMMSNARIQCVCLYYKKIKLQDMNKKLGASEIYLREDEYLEVDISGLPWLRKCPDAWRALCAYWASPSFVEKSRMKRANRQAGPRVTQRYGADGHLRLARRMVRVYYSICLLCAYLQYHNFFFIRRHKVGWHQAILKHTFEATTAQILHSQICFAVTMPRRLWLVK
jgi:hypothetical protein